MPSAPEETTSSRKPPTASDIDDLAIIGAGPTGLFAAFYAGLRQMRTKVIDSLEILGGQLTTLYPEKLIYDVPGFPSVLAKDLARGLIEQGMQYRPTVCLGEQVRELVSDDRSGVLRLLTDKSVHHARAIVIAAGVGAFQARMLPLANAKQYEGRGLYYFVKEPSAFAGKRVLIVGGGDSAVDWANMLVGTAARVTVIHRRDQFRAHEESVRRMRQSLVEVRTFHELRSIGGDGHVRQAIIYDNRSGAEEMLDVDAVLVNIGFVNSLGPIRDWGLDLEGNAIKVDSMMQTSRPGVFAAGDICTYPGKLKLIATGFGEAAIAVNYAKHYLDPSANIFPGHSTSLTPRVSR
jgi:ferredoxin/flavodoxin---NADP+ reductase